MPMNKLKNFAKVFSVREVKISIFGPLQPILFSSLESMPGVPLPYNFETSGYKRQLFIWNNNIYNYAKVYYSSTFSKSFPRQYEP